MYGLPSPGVSKSVEINFDNANSIFAERSLGSENGYVSMSH